MKNLINKLKYYLNNKNIKIRHNLNNSINSHNNINHNYYSHNNSHNNSLNKSNNSLTNISNLIIDKKIKN